MLGLLLNAFELLVDDLGGLGDEVLLHFARLRKEPKQRHLLGVAQKLLHVNRPLEGVVALQLIEVPAVEGHLTDLIIVEVDI